MEQSTFQGKLIQSAIDGAAIKVHSEEEPPDVYRRLVRFFKLGRVKIQWRMALHVHIADGCLFYGNDALRRRGGCCICLLMASGLSAKRFSIWVADAEEGEFYYTKYSKRFKLAVFIILPRLVYTPRPGVRPSEMDGRHGVQENTKDFLTDTVRHLSRLYVGKNNGQEIIWKLRPPDWPRHLSWKNPTSSPKDSKETLMEKYQYLRSQIPNEKLTREEQKAFQDFENGKMENVKSFMYCSKWTSHIDDMMKHSCDLQPSDLLLLQRKLTVLNNQLSSLLSSSTASANSCPTAAATASSLTTSRKRRSDNLTSVQSKRSKAKVLNTDILLKPSSQNACNAQFTIFAPTTVGSQSPSVERPLSYTAFQHQPQSSFGISDSLMANQPQPSFGISDSLMANQPQSSFGISDSLIANQPQPSFGISDSLMANQLQPSFGISDSFMANTCLETSQCTTSTCYTEAAAATNLQPPTAASSLFTNCDHLLGGSQEELQTVSLTPTGLSIDSGTWSQESNLGKDMCVIEIDKKKLNDRNLQSNLEFIHESWEASNFDPRIFMNLDA